MLFVFQKYVKYMSVFKLYVKFVSLRGTFTSVCDTDGREEC